MTKGIYVFVNGNVIEVSEKEFRKEIEKKQIERMYIRFSMNEKVKSVRVYDTFTAELFDEYIPLDEVFILQKRTDSNPMRIERGFCKVNG